MEVQTPSAGVRHDLLSSNIGCDTPGMICGLTREEALVFAIVRFDDDTTDVTALTQATADVGFPSKPLATN